jgi:hypothetical protein
VIAKVCYLELDMSQKYREARIGMVQTPTNCIHYFLLTRQYGGKSVLLEYLGSDLSRGVLVLQALKMQSINTHLKVINRLPQLFLALCNGHFIILLANNTAEQRFFAESLAFVSYFIKRPVPE